MFKLIALIFSAILAMVAAKPGLIATGYTAPTIGAYGYSNYGSQLPYSSGYYPLGYNGYSGILGYSQYGYNYAGPYNYYI